MTYHFRLQRGWVAGRPADPPSFCSAPGVPWKAGDTILLGRRTLRVVDTRLDRARTAIPSRCSWWNRSSLLGVRQDSRTPNLGRCYPAARRYPQRRDF
jgi:hypothetical protein